MLIMTMVTVALPRMSPALLLHKHRKVSPNKKAN